MSPRPTTLRDIAERSASLGDFGRHLRDWLHELRRVSSRTQAAASIASEPARLREKFPEGHVADAWLAAYAEHLAGGDSPALRALALAHAPFAFKRRNIFTPSVDLPLSLRAGRPTKSVEEKRRTNAERQRRFRNARLDELVTLRKLARKQARQLKAIG